MFVWGYHRDGAALRAVFRRLDDLDRLDMVLHKNKMHTQHSDTESVVCIGIMSQG